MITDQLSRYFPPLSSPTQPPPPPPPPYSSLNTSATTIFGANKCVATVRIRPLTFQDIEAGNQAICNADEDEDEGKVTLQVGLEESNGKEYHYDIVQAGSDNKALYEQSARNIVWAAMEGMNGTVIAYGQTGSGKTYSMMGVDEQPGILPQAIDDVFAFIRQQTEDLEYLFRVSYFEFYNEKFLDLLNLGQKELSIKEDKERGVYVSGLKEEIVTSPKQLMKLILTGERNRGFGTANYNERTSRANTIFQLIIEKRIHNPQAMNRLSYRPVTMSKLTLIDLAGSEDEASNNDGTQREREIHKSLLTLGNVIVTNDRVLQLLNQGFLTLDELLQTPLPGNARVSLIATISPLIAYLDETMSTLSFAEKFKNNPLQPQQNTVRNERSLLQHFKLEIAELKNKFLVSNFGLDNDRGVQGAAQSWEHEQKLHKIYMTQTAMKQKIDFLSKLILNSKSVTPKSILNWNVPRGTSVILNGLLPQRPRAETLSTSRMNRKRMPISYQVSRPDKELFSEHVAEIEKRDDQIRKFRLLLAQLKSSNDDLVQTAISSFDIDPENAVRSTEELIAENFKLQRVQEELSNIIEEQKEQLEMLEGQGQGVVPVAGAGDSAVVKSEENPGEGTEMSLTISQLQAALEEQKSLTKALEIQNQVLKTQVKNMEMDELEHLEQLAGNTEILRKLMDTMPRRHGLMESESDCEQID
ncbi:hypothetical protein HDU76_005706 [Blyttiomyces sp. JEL0837]|nr:hypothetical protein HDU76_005706 [Blyttiomyces sp. JEL0837]